MKLGRSTDLVSSTASRKLTANNPCWNYPPTPPMLPNFLENRLIPCRFRCVGGVGGVILATWAVDHSRIQRRLSEWL